MVRHTQTIRRLLSTNCLSVFEHFVRLALKGLKIQFPKVVSYRNYKNLSNDVFLKSLNSELSKYSFPPDQNNFDRFCQICTDTLNKYAPRTKKTIKGNHSPFINEEISKAIHYVNSVQIRSFFWSIFEHFSLSDYETNIACTKQQNYCVTLIKKGKKELWQPRR